MCAMPDEGYPLEATRTVSRPRCHRWEAPMSSEAQSAIEQPLGSLEYEFTDDLAFRAAWAHFDHMARGVKEGIVRQGMPHPALPIVIAAVMLVIGLAASAILAWDFYLTPYLFVAGCLVLLLLL